MKTITLVTGSDHKLQEWQRIFPDTYKLESVKLDLDEIQSLDLEKIAIDKAKRAFKVVGRPVVVEDISAGIDSWHGLPGPFIKFFEQKLGDDVLYKLASEESSCTVVAVAVYYDGTHTLIATGEIRGKIITPRGSKGFGFDVVFVPNGYDKTFAEMGEVIKDKISHRALAIRDLVRQLNDL
jgi:inosine triphosphate pyrophosphatase